MKKILFLSINSVTTPQFETELELISDHLEEGNDVYVLRCQRNLKRCFSNPDHLKSVCFSCEKRFNIGMKRVSIASNKIFLLKDEISYKDIPKIFKDLSGLKGFCVHGVNLGFGVFSYIVSELRNHIFDTIFYKDKIYKSLEAAILVYESVYELLEKLKPDVLYVFNGRFFDVWPAVKACEKLGVDFYTYERGADSTKYFLAKNCLPHDLSNVKNDIVQHWVKCNNEEINKYEIGKNLFINKRSRIDKVYGITGFDALISHAKKQKKDFLPKGFDKTKVNIAIFNSSIDEYEVFEEYKNPIYKDDYDSLVKIMENFKNRDDMQFYLRVHPNLKGLNNSQVQELKKLDSLGYKNLKIIWPEDVVDSYALMDNCDKAISFISTMLVEACYWGKPAILIGRAFFEGLDCCYKPKSHEEVIELIDSKLEPKSKEDAIKYGYWCLTFGIPHRKFKATKKYVGTFLGRSLWDDIKIKDKIKLKFLIFKESGLKRSILWQLTKLQRYIILKKEIWINKNR